jgi:hypothetical protein
MKAKLLRDAGEIIEGTDDEGHAEKVDTRDLKPLVPDNRTHDDPTDAPRRHRG